MKNSIFKITCVLRLYDKIKKNVFYIYIFYKILFAREWKFDGSAPTLKPSYNEPIRTFSD